MFKCLFLPQTIFYSIYVGKWSSQATGAPATPCLMSTHAQVLLFVLQYSCSTRYSSVQEEIIATVRWVWHCTVCRGVTEDSSSKCITFIIYSISTVFSIPLSVEETTDACNTVNYLHFSCLMIMHYECDSKPVIYVLATCYGCLSPIGYAYDHFLQGASTWQWPQPLFQWCSPSYMEPVSRCLSRL